MSVHKSDIVSIQAVIVTAYPSNNPNNPPLVTMTSVTITRKNLLEALETVFSSDTHKLGEITKKVWEHLQTAEPKPKKPRAKKPKSEDSESSGTKKKRGAPGLPYLTEAKLKGYTAAQLKDAYEALEHSADFEPVPQGKGKEKKLTKKSYIDAILAHQTEHGYLTLEALGLPKKTPKAKEASDEESVEKPSKPAKAKAEEAKEAEAEEAGSGDFDEATGLYALMCKGLRVALDGEGHAMGKIVKGKLAVFLPKDIELIQDELALWHEAVHARENPATLKEMAAEAAAIAAQGEAEEEADESEEKPEAEEEEKADDAAPEAEDEVDFDE